MAFINKLNSFVKEVGDRATDTVKIGKLNMQINEENAAITKILHQIGEMYFAAWSCGNEPGDAIARLCAEAEGHRRNIDQIRGQISLLRGLGLCAHCGAENSRNAAFCSACGHALHVKAQTPEQESEAQDEAIAEEEELAADTETEEVVAEAQEAAEEAAEAENAE